MGYVTLSDLQELKEAYNTAVEHGEEQFTFNGNELLTAYAKYLIQYLETL